MLPHSQATSHPSLTHSLDGQASLLSLNLLRFKSLIMAPAKTGGARSGPCVIDLTLSESDDDAVVEVPNPAGREGVVSPVPSTRTGSSFGPLEIIPAERRPDGPNSASRIYHNDSQQALNSNGQARGKDSVLFQALCLVDEEVDCHRGLFDDRQLTSVRAKVST